MAHLLPVPEQLPVSLLPPPGALGPSAAAARAAQAEQERQQQQPPDEEASQAGNDEQQHDPAAAAAGSAGSVGQLQAVSLAGAVLEELLTDVWADEDVISAFDRLQPAPGPTAVQLSKPSHHQQQQVGTLLGPGGNAAQVQHQALADEDQQQRPAVEAALRDQGFHAFAEYVLDNALLGSLQEGGIAAAAGAAAQDEQEA